MPDATTSRVRSGARTIARGALGFAPGPLARVVATASYGPAFGRFGLGGGSTPLLERYRDRTKGSWRSYWWAPRALLRLDGRAPLPADAAELAAELRRTRTLAVPVAEIADVVGRLADQLPEALLRTGRRDERLGVELVEPAPDPDELAQRASSYRASADDVVSAARAAGTTLGRVLDVGTGTGYLAFALAGVGAHEVVGADIDTGTEAPLERQTMLELLAGDRAAAVELVRGDVHRLDHDDASFDVVCSISAVEHFTDAAAAIAEIRRVLRPGGVAFHGADPWFGPRGGHALCTLDFPWGHLRLSRDQLWEYLHLLRPHEAADAVEAYDLHFQLPRLTLDESRRAWTAAGFELLAWRELPVPTRDPHRALVDGRLLADVKRLHPGATARDLLMTNYTVVARAV